jgi:hypothetical protein
MIEYLVQVKHTEPCVYQDNYYFDNHDEAIEYYQEQKLQWPKVEFIKLADVKHVR